MKNISVRFEPDASLDQIEVVVRAPEQDAEVNALLNLLSQASLDSLIVFDLQGRKRVLSPQEMILISTDGKRVSIITDDGIWYTRRTISRLEEELSDSGFIRISRYEIVNLSKVERYDFSLSGTLRLELTGGMETWASRRCIPAIRHRLNGKE